MGEDALKQGDDASTGERKNLEATENSRQALVDHVSKNFFHKVSVKYGNWRMMLIES